MQRTDWCYILVHYMVTLLLLGAARHLQYFYVIHSYPIAGVRVLEVDTRVASLFWLLLHSAFYT